MKINKKFGDPIELYWLDACSVDGWKSVEDAINVPEEVHCYSVGWYVCHSKEFLTICRDKGNTRKNDVSGVIHIPAKWIKKIK